MNEKKRILFVCLGNIVRSPLAENMFRHLAEQAGAGERYEVDSAGTAAYHIGEAPDARMRQVAAERGLVYSGKARQFQADDFERFDLILPMDASNKAEILRLADGQAAHARVRLLREFDPQGSPDEPVPDPYYGGLDGFHEVYNIVARATRRLFEALERGEA
ncbi:MAG: low molecular weight phosphotyrosine protein phosphatase [Chloroflexi bacterium]|nr:low molecular weight phosphotyrosine protein phosphatase [Chloroflexota bacterium]